MNGPTDIVRASFAAYRAQDRDAALRLFAEDFVFTSPQDDRLDRQAWLERCFPTADRMRWQRLVHVVELDPGEVFVMYEYELADAARYRNCELITVHDGLIHETQVFFGGRVG